MDGTQFDDLVRKLGTLADRRSIVKALGLGALVSAGLSRGLVAEAKGKGRNGGHKGKHGKNGGKARSPRAATACSDGSCAYDGTKGLCDQSANCEEKCPDATSCTCSDGYCAKSDCTGQIADGDYSGDTFILFVLAPVTDPTTATIYGPTALDGYACDCQGGRCQCKYPLVDFDQLEGIYVTSDGIKSTTNLQISHACPPDDPPCDEAACADSAGICQAGACDKNSQLCVYSFEPDDTDCTGKQPSTVCKAWTCQDSVTGAPQCVEENLTSGSLKNTCSDQTPPVCQMYACDSDGACTLQVDPDQVAQRCTSSLGNPPACQMYTCSSLGQCDTLVPDPDLETTACTPPVGATPTSDCVYGVCGGGDLFGQCIRNNRPEKTACKITASGESGVCCLVDSAPSGTDDICVPPCRECQDIDFGTCTCRGATCTYTQGYWKNHTSSWPTEAQFSTYGVTPFFGPATTFFKCSSVNYLAALALPSERTGYNALAQQYVAAQLNAANGACVPKSGPNVQAAIDAAKTLFTNNGAACTFSTSGTNSPSAQAKALIKPLTDYNEGLSGPGHCSS